MPSVVIREAHILTEAGDIYRECVLSACDTHLGSSACLGNALRTGNASFGSCRTAAVAASRHTGEELLIRKQSTGTGPPSPSAIVPLPKVKIIFFSIIPGLRSRL